MNATNTNLLEDQNFKELISFAKAIAEANQEKELDIRHLQIAIFYLAHHKLQKVTNLLGEDLLAKSDQIGNDTGIDFNNKLKPITHKDFNLKDSLREIIATHKPSKYFDFVKVLCGTNLINAILPREDPYFQRIYEYAHSIAHMNKIAYMSIEVFTLGGFLAHQNKLLANRPSIEQTYASGLLAIEYLLREKKWSVTGVKSSVLKEKLPEDFEFKKVIRDSIKSGDDLLSIINKGIAVGESLRIKERVAYHEAGHAVISLLVSPDRGISEVVLEEGQGSDGHVGYQTSSIWHQRPQSKEMVLEDIQVSLAGRIAEQKFVGYIEGIDEGASSDFRGATDNVWKAITVWGMDDEFGPLTLETCSEISGLKSGFLFDLAQQRLQIIMKENYQITENLVKDNWEHIEVLAKKLLTMNSMSMDEVLLTVPALLKSK